MTLTANVKGYINSEEWGIYKQTPEQLLLEMIAAGDVDGIVDKLNNDSDFYNGIKNKYIYGFETGSIYFEVLSTGQCEGIIIINGYRILRNENPSGPGMEDRGKVTEEYMPPCN